jgi:hypothetical protein
MSKSFSELDGGHSSNRRASRHTKSPTRARLIALALALLLVPRVGLAWLFPEHRDITAQAIEKLDPAQREALDKLWSEARSAHEARLCPEPVDSVQPAKPTCIDYASWPAIAGDHSCSAKEMLGTVLDAPWILQVAQISAKLKTQLAAAKRRDQQVNAVRDSNLALQRADPELATRAASNDAHFLLARPDVSIEPAAYAKLVLGAGAQLNALGTYAWYHLRAVAQAARIARSDLAPDARAQAAQAVLADEAFAAHFLEDAFAAGHVAGSWGDTAVRLGTHDYYNEYGIEAVTWKGKHFVALGDGYMRPEDEQRAAAAVRDSLAQVLEALAGKAPEDITPLGGDDNQPEAFNVCSESRFPTGVGTSAGVEIILVPIITQTPVPALATGKGELPRFRGELGPFLGVSSAASVEGLDGGFGSNQNSSSAVGSLELAVRTGFGLEGVMSESGDGLVFAELGLRYDSHSGSSSCGNNCNITATIPARSAVTLRLRCPFWLIPGDLIVAAPVLAFTSPKTLTKMAVEAANGGLIPYESGIATPVGRFQFVLGREIGISFYGNYSFIIPTPGVPPNNATVLSLSSTQFEFPIVEYRPFRSFSMDQSSSVLIQLYYAIDVPNGTGTVTSPTGAPAPSLQNIQMLGLRVMFDWRHYFR